jgi:hypothetical protein
MGHMAGFVVDYWIPLLQYRADNAPEVYALVFRDKAGGP